MKIGEGHRRKRSSIEFARRARALATFAGRSKIARSRPGRAQVVDATPRRSATGSSVVKKVTNVDPRRNKVEWSSAPCPKGRHQIATVRFRWHETAPRQLPRTASPYREPRPSAGPVAYRAKVKR